MEENNDLNLSPDMPEGLTPEELLGEIQGEQEEEKEELSDKDLRNLVEFTTGQKDLTDEELNDLREDETELERLLRIAGHKAQHFTYNPKKHFGEAYRNNRRRKNQQARRSRATNYAFAKRHKRAK